MKNKKIIIVLVTLTLLAGFLSFLGTKFMKPKEQRSAVKTQDASAQIEYWTCSMHPQVRKDGPGKCPICWVELIPVYREDIDKIMVDEKKQEILGLKSQPVEYRHLIKTIRLPGRISHDYEFYILQQEYLTTLSSFNKLKETASAEIIERQKALLDSTKLRLKLLGLNQDQIKEIEDFAKPDESLIYPTRGKVWIQAEIYESDLGIIKPAQTVRAMIKGYEEEEFTGRIYAIEEVLNPQTRSAKARIEIPDPENKLKHETYAQITVEVDLGSRLSIPKSSLIDTGTRKVVYLDLGRGRYQLAQVKTGIEAQDYVEVLEGVKEKDRVVTEGNFLLDSQTTLTGGQVLLYEAADEIKETPKHKHQ